MCKFDRSARSLNFAVTGGVLRRRPVNAFFLFLFCVMHSLVLSAFAVGMVDHGPWCAICNMHSIYNIQWVPGTYMAVH